MTDNLFSLADDESGDVTDAGWELVDDDAPVDAAAESGEHLQRLESMRARALEELAEIRDALLGGRSPRSPLWVLMHRSQARIGELASMLRMDPHEVEFRLLPLVDSGLVEIVPGSPRPEYRIALK